MSALGFLVAWANVPFAIAAGVTAVFALLQVSGILGLLTGGGDAHGAGEADHDHDLDADADAHADADHDADPESDHDAEHDAEHDEASERSWSAAALAPLGLGKVPFSVIWETYALAFAATGYLLNLRWADAASPPPVLSLAWTVPLAGIAGYAAVALVARILGPILSPHAQLATSRAQLVGQAGVVISSRVDAHFGEVRIRDKSGHDVRVVCRLAKASDEPVPQHGHVVVVDYVAARGELLVEALDDGLERSDRWSA